MPDSLPLNAHFRRDGEELVQAFADCVTAKVTPADWGDAAKMAAYYAQRDAIAARIAEELIQGGAEPEVAKFAADKFMSFGFAPSFGLGDSYGSLPAKALVALNLWTEARLAAFRAAKPLSRRAA